MTESAFSKRGLALGGALLLAVVAGAWLLALGHTTDSVQTGASRDAGAPPRTPRIPDDLPSLAPQGKEGGSPPIAPGSEDTHPDPDASAPAPPALTVRVVDPEGQVVDWAELAFLRGAQVVEPVFVGDPPRDVRGYLGKTADLGGWIVEVKDPQRDGARLGPARVGPLSPGTTTVEIRLPRGEVIEGLAVGPSGEAVQGGLVEARPAPSREGEVSAWHAHGHATARSGPDGRFRLEGLEKGPYLLVGGQSQRGDVGTAGTPAVERVGEYYGSDPVRVEAPSTGARVSFRVGVPVDVEVVDASGRTVDGAEVGFWPSFDRPQYVSVFRAVTRGGVARVGRLDPNEPGLLRLTPPAERPDLAEREVEGWTPAVRRFELASIPTIAGVVRDPRGLPVAGAIVVVETPGEDGSRTVLSGPDGGFRVGNPTAGTLTLRARARPGEDLRAASEPDAEAIWRGLRDGEGAEEPELVAAPVVAEADATDVHLTVEPGVRRTVRVRAPNAERYVGQRAQLRRFSPKVSRWRQEVVAGGVIPLEHLVPGASYSLFVPGPEGLPPLWIERLEGVVGDLEIEPAHTTPVRGRLLLGDGEPAPRVRVGLFAAGWWAYGTTQDDGTFRIEHAIAFPAQLEEVPELPRRVGDPTWRPVAVSHSGASIEMRAVRYGQAREQR